MKSLSKWNRRIRNTLLILGISLCTFFFAIIPIAEHHNKRKNSFSSPLVAQEEGQTFSEALLGKPYDPCLFALSEHPSYECKKKRKRDAVLRKIKNQINAEIELSPREIKETKYNALWECEDGNSYSRSGLRLCYNQKVTEAIRIKITTYRLEKYRLNEGISLSECRAEREKAWAE